MFSLSRRRSNLSILFLWQGFFLHSQVTYTFQPSARSLQYVQKSTNFTVINISRISKPAFHWSVLRSRFTWLSKVSLRHSGARYQTQKGDGSHSLVSFLQELFWTK